MVKKCDAICDAQNGARPLHLWLRKNVFYCRMELDRIDGKRRYKRISLHTNNFYEAQEKIKLMAFEIKKEIYEKAKVRIAAMGLQSLNPRVMKQIVEQCYREYSDNQINAPERFEQTTHQAGVIDSVLKELKPFLKGQLQSIPSALPATHPQYTIQEVVDGRFIENDANNKRKRSEINVFLKTVQLELTDTYDKFHTPAVIKKIVDSIVNRSDIKNNCKITKIRYLKELMTHACNMDDCFSPKLMNTLPKIPKTKKTDKKPHMPYSDSQLVALFDPKRDFFHEHPDEFWVCMIALFTGARMNAALTLQYDDIISEDGLYCVHFRENHPIKSLKNEASGRIVPIHKQLLDLGFVDYMNRKKKRLKASGTDFINPKAITKGQKYNNKYFVRELSPFFQAVGIKSGQKDGFDFHSFRNNISNALDEAKVSGAYINRIVGWDGSDMREKHYSKHTIPQIKKKLDSFEYDFLKPHFEKWKAIMAKK